jgi:hypothetical protein
MENEMHAVFFFVRKKPLGKCRRRCRDNIEVALKGMGYEVPGPGFWFHKRR